MEQALKIGGKELKSIKRVMMVGGSKLALKTAKKLQDQYKLKVIISDESVCKKFVEALDGPLIINADPSDIDTLKEEGLDQMDAFIALTENTETNIVTSLMAEQMGVYKTIALVENVTYTHISQHIGIDTIINQKLIAANNIFRFVRKGKVEAIASLHGVDAEIIEYTIHRENHLIKHPIKDLHLPEKSIIAGIIRDSNGFVPTGEDYFKINDKVIVFSLPDAIPQIEQIFN